MIAQPESSLSLKGKVALITGSGKARGIGAGIATTLAQHGASVVINYVSASTASSAAAVAEGIAAAGGKVLVVQADISRPEEAQRLVAETVIAFEKIDILVNNAGTGFPGPALSATPESMATTFGVNVFGPLYLVQAAVAHMPPRSRVINIGSVASKLGVSGSPIYLASKAATDALTLAMAAGPRSWRHNDQHGLTWSRGYGRCATSCGREDSQDYGTHDPGGREGRHC